jgi:hypothetical protein
MSRWKKLQSYIFARYSGFNKWIQSPVELYSRPNVSTLQSSVFIRGDLKTQLTMWVLYTHGMTSSANKMDIFLRQISTVIPIFKAWLLQHNTTQHNTTQHNTTQHNTTQHNTTQHNINLFKEASITKVSRPLQGKLEVNPILPNYNILS